MNSKLFNEYILMIFFLCIDKPKSNKEFANKNVILLMDNCSLYTNEIIIKESISHCVKVIAWSLRIIHIFQVSDLSLSDVLKREHIAMYHFIPSNLLFGSFKRYSIV